ncbi:MAG: efflux RND transporter periplasmic adaptor subunit [Planctomycetota bacterium]
MNNLDSRPWRWVLVGFVTVALVGVGGCSFEMPEGVAGKTVTEAEEEPEEARTLVVVEAPRRDVIRESVTLNGDLEALDMIELTSTVAERVRTLHAKEGDVVAAGALLVQFEDREQQFALREALQRHEEAKETSASAALDEREAGHTEELRKIAYEKAAREYARIEKVIAEGKQKALTQEEIEQKSYARDDARLQWEVARTAKERSAVTTRLRKLAEEQASIAVDKARHAQSQTAIRSPIDGVIALLEVRPGEFVSSGALVASVVSSKQLYTDVRLPQRTLPLLVPGKRVAIEAEVYPGVQFGGRVDVVHPTIDATEGTVKVRVMVDPDLRLRPGMYAAVSLDLLVHEDALLVPKRARLFENSESILFVAREGRAHRIPVQIGLQNSRELEVLPNAAAKDALRDDDQIIVRGQSQLKDGMAVVIEGEAEAEAVESDDAGDDPEATAADGETAEGREG